MSPEDEVLATARKIIDAFNAQDKETMAALHDPVSAYAADGGLLQTAEDDSPNGQPRSMPDRWSMSHWKHPKVRRRRYGFYDGISRGVLGAGRSKARLCLERHPHFCKKGRGLETHPPPHIKSRFARYVHVGRYGACSPLNHINAT